MCCLMTICFAANHQHLLITLVLAVAAAVAVMQQMSMATLYRERTSMPLSLGWGGMTIYLDLQKVQSPFRLYTGKWYNASAMPADMKREEFTGLVQKMLANVSDVVDYIY